MFALNMKGLQNSSSLFPNLQKNNPENNTAMCLNKEKVLFISSSY